jgi:large subunit ribosomal protein L1
MINGGKKYRKAADLVQRDKFFTVRDALAQVKSLAYAKFDESVDVNISLGIDATKGEQVVRGSVVLPHGKGKKARIIVFAKGDYATQAKEAGADYVGDVDLIEKIKGGWLDFEFAIATPDLMGAVGQLAKILGPRNLLPNKKLGTVTYGVADVVADLKRGRVFFKNDKQGLVHFTIGKVSFDANKLYDNFVAFIKALAQVRPATAKGKFLKKASVSSTMGVGVRVGVEEFAALP